MAERTSPRSRSPSPMSMGPTPLQMMPGPRAGSFIRTYNDALKRILTDCNYDNFAQCFPTPAKYNPEALQTLHRGLVNRLGERCYEEFDVIMQERNVVMALNDLDRLIADARQRRSQAHQLAAADGGPVRAPIPPHTLAPEKLLNAQLGPQMHAQESELKAQLEHMQSSNHELSDRIRNQRLEIDAILGQMRAGVEDLDAALASVTHDQLVELTHEAVRDDAAMSA